jgi:uncharacterized membrane protein
MPTEQQHLQPQSLSSPPLPRTIRGGQHVSGDVWRSAFKETKADRLAKFLGWFSVGLGITEVVFPKTLAKAIGAPKRPMLTRLMGLREITAGVGILNTPQPAAWVKARVWGDAIDLAMLMRSYGSDDSGALRLTGATAMVAGVAALDVICAKELSQGPAAVMESASTPGAVYAEASFAINKSPEECYRFWRNPENLPRFMKYLESVRVTGERTSHWSVKLGNRTAQWNSEITSDTPNEEIAWQSTPGSTIETSGSVRFEPRLSGPGAIVRVAMQYTPPGGQLMSLINPLMETVSEHQLREDLRHLKNLMESGEIATTTGQSSGRKSEQQGERQ